MIYKVLKHACPLSKKEARFLPIIIYKVLKLLTMFTYAEKCFLPIIIYKVLKHRPVCMPVRTRFLTHHNLQGSQTFFPIFDNINWFLTHHNLQGSQTQ